MGNAMLSIADVAISIDSHWIDAAQGLVRRRLHNIAHVVISPLITALNHIIISKIDRLSAHVQRGTRYEHDSHR
jgi:hypothetical protein